MNIHSSLTVCHKGQWPAQHWCHTVPAGASLTGKRPSSSVGLDASPTPWVLNSTLLSDECWGLCNSVGASQKSTVCPPGFLLLLFLHFKLVVTVYLPPVTHVLTSQSPCLAPSLQLFMSLKSLPQSCSLLATPTSLSGWPQLLANLWHHVCSGNSQRCSFSQSPALSQPQSWLDSPPTPALPQKASIAAGGQ